MSRDAFISELVPIAYAAQSRGKGRDMRQVQWFTCKQFGHVARSCNIKFCNYCKQKGHFISDCSIRPPLRTRHPITWRVPLNTWHNLHYYDGNQKIQIANGNTLSITNVGDINSDFQDVLVSLGLASNLLYVGQLVDDNCNVNFSCDVCLVQEQVSGKVVAKGPKVGRLFPFQFISNQLSLACNNVLNSFED